MTYRSIKTLQSDLKNGTISAVEVLNNYIHQIEEQKDLNAFIEVLMRQQLNKRKL
ncbi:MAG: hypothetical protein R2728_03485 [Chitinophagales bacterium]